MRKSVGLGIGGVFLVARACSTPAVAACTNTPPANGSTVACSGSGVPSVVAPAASTNVTIDIDNTASGSFTRAVNAVAYGVDTSSSITNAGNLTLAGAGSTGTQRGAAMLGANNGNTLNNAAGAVITTGGSFNDGMAANGSNNTLVNNGTIRTSGPNAYGMTAAWGQTNLGQSGNALINTGNVSTTGSNARAASILGGSGTINNSGTLSTSGSASVTVYMQGNADRLINTGTISASGTASDAVFSNTVASTLIAVIENRAGGRIVSQSAAAIRTLNGNSTVINAGLVQSNAGTAISMGTGSDSLILQTGSSIVGTADGGGGTNTVTLQGTGTASNAFTNFRTLLMQGAQWDWTGSGTFALARVQTGTLNLVGTLGAAASAIVDAGATLQANAQALPATVTDNGIVRFTQADVGTYTGNIAGAGSVEKTGAGTLTLAPSSVTGNTYSGGTIIAAGVLAAGADNALGASTGGITFDGGALQLNQSFDLAASRAIALNAGGGTIDTQSFDMTIAQSVAGSGALTKTGTGTLLMTGASSYACATNVAAGTLAIGDDAHRDAALAGGGGVNVAAGATLGGYGSVSGPVQNSGTIAVANALASMTTRANGAFTINGSLDNAGVVQIGGTGVGNQLRVVGNYVGHGGVIALNAVVAQDGATSDRLVIDGGSTTGATSLRVTNVGGAGAQTLANGIQVVEAANGASTNTAAFTLAAPVKAGAYEYFLAKGGVTAGVSDDWFLRNTVAPLPAPAPIPIPAVVFAAGTPPLPAPPPAGSPPIPLYRPEVPVYAEIASVARHIGYLQLDTFHERQGDQALLTETGRLPAAWGRVWGGHSAISQDGDASPAFDGSVYGVQIGHDLYADSNAAGHRNHYGLFAGFTRAGGDVNGFALGTPGFDAGHLAIDAYTLGGYWTHIGPSGWYTDAVLSGSALHADPASSDGTGATTHGTAIAGSIEGGLPVAVGAGVSIEPQAQLIWQHLSIDDLNDGVSNVTFSRGNTFVARLGARVTGTLDRFGTHWQPWLRVNVLRTFGSDDTTTFGDATALGTQVGQTAAQIGAGVVARIGRAGSMFATVSWLTNLGGTHQRTVTGNAGVRWSW
ncbi:hypothetical protein PTKU46_43650 [Paraburkholderia terrae]|uniref:autotransporter family protein n=1 Tax=Paraburkholderia terrae TaxID=311230 RepID=UPI0030E372F4